MYTEMRICAYLCICMHIYTYLVINVFNIAGHAPYTVHGGHGSCSHLLDLASSEGLGMATVTGLHHKAAGSSSKCHLDRKSA